MVLGFLYGSSAIMNATLAAKRDAWLATILSLSVSLVIITVYLYISKLNPDKTLVEILQHCLGKFFGSIIAFFYLFTFLHLMALNLRGVGDFMTTVSYPETPLPVIMLILMLIVVYVVLSGLNVLGRVSEIIVIFIPINIIILFSSVFTRNNPGEFLPVMENGLGQFWADAYGILTFPYGDLITFLMIFPFLAKQEGKFKATYIGTIAAGVVFLITVIRNTVVIGPVLIGKLTYTSDVAAKLIPVVSIEPIIELNLLMGGGIKMSVFLYAVTKGFAQLFKVQNYKLLIPAFAVLAFALALWVFPSASEGVEWLQNSDNIYFVFPFHIFFPVLVLIISHIKQRKASVTEKQAADRC